MRRLSKELPKQYSKLSRLSKRYIETHSWSADLRISIEYVIDALRWHATRRESLGYAKTALIQTAVIGYARIFDTSSNHRSDFKIGGKLSVEASKFHAKLLRLRHESLAHFGPEGIVKPWSEDMCVVVRDGITWQPAVIARRSQFESQFATMFRDHLEQVQKIVSKQVTQLQVDFQNELARVWHVCEEFDDIIKKYEIDPDVLGGWDGPVLSNRSAERMVIQKF